MRKIVSIIITFAIILGITNYSLAADEYSFDLQYTGTVIKNEEKSAKVLLIGKSGTLYSKVRIKVDVNGPAKPKIMATDSNNVEHDIAEIGYWGPPDGFPVQGDFTNTTPIRATFPEKGKYTITLSLINLENDSVITTKSFEINVVEEAIEDNNNNTTNNTTNTITNNTTNNIEELPKTGKSIWEYTIYLASVVIVLGIAVMYIKYKNK